MRRFADLLLRYPRRCFAALVAVTLAFAGVLLTTGVRFDYNLENFLPAGDPTIQQYRAFTEAYEPDDVYVVVGFDVEDAFAFETLRDVQAMTREIEALDGVEGVVSLATFENLRGTAEGVEIRPLLPETLVENPDSLAAYRARVLDDRLATGFVVNDEATATGLVVEIERERNSYAARGAVIAAVKEVLAPYQRRYAFRYSGYPYLRNTYVETLQVEMVKYVALSSLVILVALAWMFRSVRGVVVPLVTVYLGVLWTVGAMMLFGSAIDVLTSTLAAIVLVVAVADSIHLLAKYHDGLAEGLGKRAALRQTLERLGAATFLTSATTAIGFGTLATSKVLPMQRFGIFTAVGVMLTFAISLVLVGTVAQWTRPPTAAQVERIGRGGFRPLLVWLDAFTYRHARAIAVGSLAVVGLGLWGATGLRVNAFVNDDMGPRTQAYQDMVYLQERLVSPFRFEVLLTADDADAFKDPALWARVERLEGWLEARPEVGRVLSGADLLRQMNRVMHADSAAYDRLPEAEDLTAQYLFLLELTDEDALRRLVDFDYREARLSASMDDVGSARLEEFQAAFAAVAAEILGPDITVTQTGTNVLAANLSDYLVESLLVSIGLAFVFISALMGALFRNLKLVLISLVPNVVPLVVVAGVMGVLGIDIKPATAVIFSVAFGIAVDDTIHFLARLKQEARAGRPLREAVRAALLGTGKAIVLTSLILLGGFLVLMTSSFQSTMYMGGLISLTIAMALLADLLLLPALLHLLQPRLPGPDAAMPGGNGASVETPAAPAVEPA